MAAPRPLAHEQLAIELAGLDEEVRTFYDEIVKPRWNSHSRRYSHTLYAYVMRSFSFVDLISALYREKEKDQTKRMTELLCDFFGADREVAFIAVQIWRHKLMHTAFPQQLEFQGNTYVWLLHWGAELPEDQHFTFSQGPEKKVLNLSLLYFIANLKRSWAALEKDEVMAEKLRSDADLFQPYAHCQKVNRPKWW